LACFKYSNFSGKISKLFKVAFCDKLHNPDPCQPCMSHPQVSHGGNGLQMKTLASNILNELSLTAGNSVPPFGFGPGAETSSP
jgi:hypothetical protein